MKYFIRPYKTRWHEDNDLFKSTRLNIMDLFTNKSNETIFKFIKRVLNIAQIYHLEIFELQTAALLIQILNLLPELRSLRIYSLSYDQPKTLNEEEFHSFLCSRKKITKVYVEQMLIIDEVFFLMMLFPYVTHFKIDGIYNMDIESCLMNILAEINDHLRSLCFCAPTADDQMIKTLEKMIDDNELLIDYKIKRVLDNIYLQWK